MSNESRDTGGYEYLQPYQQTNAYAARRYDTVIQEIHSGGEAVIEKVHDNWLNMPIARKRLKTELAEKKENEKRFVHNAQLQAKLRHPNIIPVLDIVDESPPFYTMPYVEHITLHTLLLAKHGKIGKMSEEKLEITHSMLHNISVRKLIQMFQDMCSFVSYIHEKNVVHLDIKSSNILISEDGTIFVTDFGVSMKIQQIACRQNCLLGTVGYLDPRLVDANFSTGKQADIYGLGMILLEILASRYDEANFFMPYEKNYNGKEDDTLRLMQYYKEICERKNRVLLPRYDELSSEIPDKKALQEICETCLSTDRYGKMSSPRPYEDAKQIAGDLKSLWEHQCWYESKGYHLRWHKKMVWTIGQHPSSVILALLIFIASLLTGLLSLDIQRLPEFEKHYNDRNLEFAEQLYKRFWILTWFSPRTQEIEKLKERQKQAKVQYHQSKDKMAFATNPITLQDCQALFGNTKRIENEIGIIQTRLDGEWGIYLTKSDQTAFQSEIDKLKTKIQNIKKMIKNFEDVCQKYYTTANPPTVQYPDQEFPFRFMTFIGSGTDDKMTTLYLVYQLYTVKQKFDGMQDRQIAQADYHLLCFSVLRLVVYPVGSFHEPSDLPLYKEEESKENLWWVSEKSLEPTMKAWLSIAHNVFYDRNALNFSQLRKILDDTVNCLLDTEEEKWLREYLLPLFAQNLGKRLEPNEENVKKLKRLFADTAGICKETLNDLLIMHLDTPSTDALVEKLWSILN